MSNVHGILKRLYSVSAGYDIADPGNAGTINVDRQLGLVKLVSGGTETRTLPAPEFAGAILTVSMKTDGGDVTLTVTGGFDEAANTAIVFSATGQYVMLVSVEEGANKRWRVVGYDGVTGPTIAFGEILTSAITTGTISEATAGGGVTIDGAKIRDGNVIVAQGDPTAETGVATIAAADIMSGIVTVTHTVGATVALTVDTGSAMDTALSSVVAIGQAVDWSIINLSAAAADTATLTAASGHTLVGIPIVQSSHTSTGDLYGNAARFRSRRTAANTWITYRIG